MSAGALKRRLNVRYIIIYILRYIYLYIEIHISPCLPLNLRSICCFSFSFLDFSCYSLSRQETQPSVSRHLHAAAAAACVAASASVDVATLLPFWNLDSNGFGLCDWGALSHFYALAGLECGLPRYTNKSLSLCFRFRYAGVTYTQR